MSFATIDNDKCGVCNHERWRHGQNTTCFCGEYMRNHPVDGCGGGVQMEEEDDVRALPFECLARGCVCKDFKPQEEHSKSFAEALAKRGQHVVKCEFHRNEGKRGFCSCLW